MTAENTAPTQRSTSKPRTAAIAGATGMVGAALLQVFLQKDLYDTIYVLSRRPLQYDDPRITVLEVDFENLNEHVKIIAATDYYCCLGCPTWNPKKTSSLKKVDFEYSLSFAQLGKQAGCEQFSVITSLGASASSPIYYNQIKGRLERSLRNLHFKDLHLFRPSLLIGHRTKRRLWEEVGKWISIIVSFFLIGNKGNFLSIDASTVAKAIAQANQQHLRGVQSGVQIYGPSQMHNLSKKLC